MTTGADVLDLIETYLSRFVTYPNPEARTAHVLWCAHTHTLAAFETTPRLVFTSADPGSGKSRALELTALFAHNAIHSVGGSTAWLVRTGSENTGTTMLLDEYDTIFAVGRTTSNEYMRSVLNAGHRRGPKVGRVDKQPNGGLRSVEFDPFGAVALAGLGSLPATVRDRSITITMRPPGPDERPSPWRTRDHGPEAADIYEQLADWAAEVTPHLAGARPRLPATVVDRRADVWEPLIALADAAGGTWPQRARTAAVAFIATAAERPISWGMQLLTDCKTVFDQRPGVGRIRTADLLEALAALPESAWSTAAGGTDLTARQLATILARYDIRSRDIREGPDVRKGYTRASFLDAWTRHLDPEDTPPTTGERRARRRKKQHPDNRKDQP